MPGHLQCLASCSHTCHSQHSRQRGWEPSNSGQITPLFKPSGLLFSFRIQFKFLPGLSVPCMVGTWGQGCYFSPPAHLLQLPQLWSLIYFFLDWAQQALPYLAATCSSLCVECSVPQNPHDLLPHSLWTLLRGHLVLLYSPPLLTLASSIFSLSTRFYIHICLFTYTLSPSAILLAL